MCASHTRDCDFCGESKREVKMLVKTFGLLHRGFTASSSRFCNDESKPACAVCVKAAVKDPEVNLEVFFVCIACAIRL